MTPHRQLVSRSAIRQIRILSQTERLGSEMDRLVWTAGKLILQAKNLDHPAFASLYMRLAFLNLEQALKRLLAVGLAAITERSQKSGAKSLVARLKAMPKKQESSLWDWLIHPPGEETIRQLVGPAPDRLTLLVPAQKASDIVTGGIADGLDRKAIAAKLETVLSGIGSAARRVARTEGLRVATASQLSVSEQIPDLIQGYQVCAVLDDRTRPEHRARNGTIYYRQPKYGQLGFDRMPQPPIDPGNKIAYNCRCILIPVLSDDPIPSPIPDPDTMGKFFATASIPERERAVGAERMSMWPFERAPRWRDFLGQDDELLPLSALLEIWKTLAG